MLACGTSMTKKRRRVKHIETFEERLAQEAIKFKEAADKQPIGSMARELLLRRVRQAETAAHMSQWLSSPGLFPPRNAKPLACRSAEVSPPLYYAIIRQRTDIVLCWA